MAARKNKRVIGQPTKSLKDIPEDVMVNNEFPFLSNEDYVSVRDVNSDLRKLADDNQDKFSRIKIDRDTFDYNFEEKILKPYLYSHNQLRLERFNKYIDDEPVAEEEWMFYDEDGTEYNWLYKNYETKKKDQGYIIYGIGGYIASAGTFIFGNATQRMKNFMRDHGEEEITSIKLGREPIKSAIASVMELISLGEFSKSQEKRGYDAFFHLYLILNDKYVLEKNQNVNYKSYTPNDNEEIFDVSLSGNTGNTINEFIKNGEQFMGENKYWQGYNPLVNNCQKWVESNLQANDVDSKAAKDFYYQDTEDLIQAIEPNVQDFLEETTDVASGLEKFISWLSDGAWGFKKGGMVRRRIGYMK